ncbi:hypothetical protein BP6252_09654 [Coleophoma cylindrospora]|uniref:Indole-diterpene biosynthesis protein PaxU n=1 Tax=Coleophoma cylindrospora TaxID=1849047 RepID=A0A3D8QW78_9HELO|nr:hypothetical protein BP6252_09654 [Coleophoma cylindrospora]
MASPITSSTALQPDSEMTMPATIQPLHNFTKLTSNISIYTPEASPPTAGPKPSTQHPTTILFCSWLNAHPRHIAKFLAHHQLRYPSARIILVTINTQQFIFESEAKRKHDMAPVVAALLAGPPTTRGTSTAPNDRLLVHVCSSGGAKRLYNILGAYRAQTQRALPARAVIYDSSPGIPHFASGLRALLAAGAKLAWWAWIPFWVSMVVLNAGIIFTVHCTGLMKDFVWNARDGLNDGRLVDGRAVRGYVYSEEDRVVEARDIERHAEEAVGRGVVVRRCVIPDAEHVKLFVGGREREDVYWGFVDETWRWALDGTGRS